ncbi:hypothetical protein ACWCPF_26105 [Streptomyces sp. NPDC001858]
MTTDQTPHRAVLTVTVTSRPDGGHYFDPADFAAHVTGWVRAGLKGRHAVDEVTIVDQAAELARAQAEAHQYRTALQGVARREAATSVPSPSADRATLRDRIRRAVCVAEGFGFAWGTDMLEPDEYGEVADRVLAVLPDRPAFDQAADVAEDVAESLRKDHEFERSTGALDVMTELRRLAAEQPTETQASTADKAAAQGMSPAEYRAASHRSAVEQIRTAAQGLYATAAIRVMAALDAEQPDTLTPRRGDPVEAWLKARRKYTTTWHDWHTLDDLLDAYRLHADTGTPLGKHVCEGDGCDHQEQPDTQTREAARCVCGHPIELQDEDDPTTWIHTPGRDTHCVDARPLPSDTAVVLQVVSNWHRGSESRDVLVEELTLAGFAVPHSCKNCEGIDPDTCLMNPDRP